MATTANLQLHRAIGPLRYHGIAANTVIWANQGVCLNSAGYAVHPSETTGLITVGAAVKYVSNNPGAAGDKGVTVAVGVFGFANSASSDLITIAEIGDDCYWIDGGTVAKTSNSNARSIAGKIVFLENSLVYVAIGLGMGAE